MADASPILDWFSAELSSSKTVLAPDPSARVAPSSPLGVASTTRKDSLSSAIWSDVTDTAIALAIWPGLKLSVASFATKSAGATAVSGVAYPTVKG